MVTCFVLGSYISICRALGPGSGKYLANLFIEPSLQNSGCCWAARVRAVTHTRPWLSIATLRGSDDRCHTFSSPQYGDVGVLVSIGGAFEGILMWVGAFSRGASTARLSALSMAPYTSRF